MNRQTLQSNSFLSLGIALTLLCGILFAFAVSAGSVNAVGAAAVSLTDFGATIHEDFNTLASTSSSGTLPNGWYFEETGPNANITYTAGTGSNSPGDTYSFGAAGSTDRAFGTLQSGTLIPTIGAKFTNDTGGVINSLSITYTGEEWRLGTVSRTDRLDFQLSTNAITLTSPSATWTDYDALDFTTPFTASAGTRDGNASANRTIISYTITGLSIPSASNFWLRWLDFNASLSDDGLAIDDFALTPLGVELAPEISGTFPLNMALDVPVTSSIVITLSEPVITTGTWFTITGSSSGLHNASVTGGPTVYTLDPVTDFSQNESVLITVIAAQLTDFDTNDPPDNLSSNYSWTFTTIPLDYPPRVVTTFPLQGAINIPPDATILITFNEPINAVESWFDIMCTNSGLHAAAVSDGPTTFTIDPDVTFVSNDVCTVTVLASHVTDQDPTDPPDMMQTDYIWTFGVAPPAYFIHAIQGIGHISPFSGTVVSVYDEIVTAKMSSGFYIQERDIRKDSDPSTSEGIFVYTNSAPMVNTGDSVNVFGLVVEFRSGAANLSRTEIDTTVNGGMVEIDSFGNALPQPITIGSGGRVPPTTILENDNAHKDIEQGNTFDPFEDGLDFFESLEGMLVQVNNAVAVGPTMNAELVVLADNGGNGAGNPTARGGIIVRSTDKNPERLILASSIIVGSVPNVNVGATFATTVPITAVLDYNFDGYKLQVTAKPITGTNGITPETTGAPSSSQLAVATFNVQNLSPTDSAMKFNRLGSLIVNNLKSPDLLVIEEVQDNNGVTDDGIVAADITMGKLITAISNAGGPNYQYRQINPVNDQDGGAPGGNIRIVFIFRTDRGLSFVDRPGGTSTNSTSPVGNGADTHLTYSPGRIDPTNDAWNQVASLYHDGSRKPLVGEFLFQGQRVFVIGNHWKSKNGDDPLFGRYQPAAQFTQPQRLAQSIVVKNFVDSILTLDPNAKVIVAGDFNDFEFSEPLTTLKGTTLHALIEDLAANERYNYVFEGNSQALDHILISTSLYTNASPQFDIVHVNSEFYDQVSDHDPSIVRLSFSRLFLPLIVR